MPCRDPFEPSESNDCGVLRHENEILKYRLDVTTRLLCGILTQYDRDSGNALGRYIGNDAEVMNWWASHKQDDKNLRDKKNALNKLTRRERMLLGLDPEDEGK